MIKIFRQKVKIILKDSECCEMYLPISYKKIPFSLRHNIFNESAAKNALGVPDKEFIPEHEWCCENLEWFMTRYYHESNFEHYIRCAPDGVALKYVEVHKATMKCPYCGEEIVVEDKNVGSLKFEERPVSVVQQTFTFSPEV